MKEHAAHLHAQLLAVFLLTSAIGGCVSEESYNDMKNRNIQLQEQILRASGLNRQLQDFVDRHIQDFHTGENISVPHFQTQMIPAFVKDSEIRNLRIEINRLRRESEYKERVIRDLTEKCGDATETQIPAIHVDSVK